MNCVNHPEAPAIAYCRECGKALCETCRRQADGIVYCEEHAPAAALPATAAAGAPPPPPAPPPMPASPYTAPEPPHFTTSQPLQPSVSDAGASPGLAFLLGFIAGAGAI